MIIFHTNLTEHTLLPLVCCHPGWKHSAKSTSTGVSDVLSVKSVESVWNSIIWDEKKDRVYHAYSLTRLSKRIKDAPKGASLILSLAFDRQLLGLDSLRGTSVGACTAIYAEIGVDNILGIAFRDSLRGTLVNASTALDTVVSDYVSHNSNIFKLCV